MALTASFSSLQQELNIVVVRGDTFSRKLVQIENEDDTPADLTGYEFSLQVRKAPRTGSSVLTITDSEFLLGQSDEAIAYDVDEGNPAGTTKDEIHVNAPASMMRVKAGNWYYDLQIIDTGGDVFSPIYGRFNIKQDTTRTNE
jgi:hypothetical protein